jgi:hypothetical protein
VSFGVIFNAAFDKHVPQIGAFGQRVQVFGFAEGLYRFLVRLVAFEPVDEIQNKGDVAVGHIADTVDRYLRVGHGGHSLNEDIVTIIHRAANADKRGQAGGGVLETDEWRIAMKDITQIGLRAQSELNERLDVKAKEIGISKNALILVMLELGLRAYEKVNQPAQQE